MENLNLSSSPFVTTLGTLDLCVKAVHALCRSSKSFFLGQVGVVFEMHM